MQDWNRNNPTSPLTIDMAGVRRRVIAMRQDKVTRLSNAAPNAIRAEVKKALAEGFGLNWGGAMVVAGLALAGFLIHPIAFLGVLAGLAWLWRKS